MVHSYSGILLCQTEKVKYHNIHYMWKKINVEITCKTNRSIVVENKLPREKGGGGVNLEIGIDIYTLIYIK